jgi:hypothetical protein
MAVADNTRMAVISLRMISFLSPYEVVNRSNYSAPIPELM